jgi:hypothetical protein
VQSKPRNDPLLERIRRDIAEGNSNTPLSDLDRAILENHKPQRRGPFIPVDVDNHATRLVWIGGREQPVHDVIATFKQTDIERFRQGFGCLNCWQEFESAFPERCHVCGYEVRRRQTHDFGHAFEGDRWIGSQVNVDEESQIMDDHLQQWKLEHGLRSRGVWIP